MLRVKPFNNFKEPIAEAYFPKLESLTASRGWPPRQSNMIWKDLNRPKEDVNVTIADLERWRSNIEEAIALNFAKLVRILLFKLY